MESEPGEPSLTAEEFRKQILERYRTQYGNQPVPVGDSGAARYGRLALKLGKVAALAGAGLVGTALGGMVGAPGAGIEGLKHAVAEAIQIAEDPWD
jgi:hypothetical protein